MILSSICSRYSFFFATSIAISIYTNLDTVMLGFMTDDTQVGLYSASVKVKTVLLAVVSSLGKRSFAEAVGIHTRQ